MTSAPLRRKSKPNNLRGAPHSSGFIHQSAEPIHDRSAERKYNSDPVTVEITDPFGDRVYAQRERRDDPLANLRSKDIIGEADYAAGRHWQDAYEASQIGSVRAIDPCKEAVDGGRPPENLTDRQLRGAKDVNAAREVLGPVGNALVQDVLGDGLSMEGAAAKRGMTSARDRNFLSRRLRECLATMAVLFGLAMRPKGSPGLIIP